jgi:hypothetical protein
MEETAYRSGCGSPRLESVISINTGPETYFGARYEKKEN